MMPFTIGIIGARGYVGGELLKLINADPMFTVAFASSRQNSGALIQELQSSQPGIRYELLQPDDLAQRTIDVLILALPNNLAAPYVAAMEVCASETLLIDLSADYRFDDNWTYGLPELVGKTLHGTRRIANPGCYATAMQIALHPMRDLMTAAPSCFGVSGYSGAGTTPGPNNDPDNLRDNLIPYKLTDHIHEREVTRHLQHPVHFSPHVAAFFRGLSITAHISLTDSTTLTEVRERYHAQYAKHTHIHVMDTPPQIRNVVHSPDVHVGGFALSPADNHLVVVSVLDNLLKGAASQAMQNIKLALAVSE